MSETLYDVLSPMLATAGLDLVDLEVTGGLVRVTVDRVGGIDLEALAAANKTVSAALDELDPIPGRYTLEVTSPGVERRLRTPEHFARAVGETVSVRTLGGTNNVRRVQGRLAAAGPDGFELEGSEVPGGSLHLAYGDVERARTVFEWGPTAPPAGNRRTKHSKRATTGTQACAAGAKKDAKTERVTTP